MNKSDCSVQEVWRSALPTTHASGTEALPTTHASGTEALPNNGSKSRYGGKHR